MCAIKDGPRQEFAPPASALTATEFQENPIMATRAHSSSLRLVATVMPGATELRLQLEICRQDGNRHEGIDPRLTLLFRNIDHLAA